MVTVAWLGSLFSHPPWYDFLFKPGTDGIRRKDVERQESEEDKGSLLGANTEICHSSCHCQGCQSQIEGDDTPVAAREVADSCETIQDDNEQAIHTSKKTKRWKRLQICDNVDTLSDSVVLNLTPKKDRTSIQGVMSRLYEVTVVDESGNALIRYYDEEELCEAEGAESVDEVFARYRQDQHCALEIQCASGKSTYLKGFVELTPDLKEVARRKRSSFFQKQTLAYLDEGTNDSDSVEESEEDAVSEKEEEHGDERLSEEGDSLCGDETPEEAAIDVAHTEREEEQPDECDVTLQAQTPVYDHAQTTARSPCIVVKKSPSFRRKKKDLRWIKRQEKKRGMRTHAMLMTLLIMNTLSVS